MEIRGAKINIQRYFHYIGLKSVPVPVSLSSFFFRVVKQSSGIILHSVWMRLVNSPIIVITARFLVSRAVYQTLFCLAATTTTTTTKI